MGSPVARPPVRRGKEEPKPLYGIFRDGKRVYLPPKRAVGVEKEAALLIAAHLPGAEIVCVFDPEEEIGEAA